MNDFAFTAALSFDRDFVWEQGDSVRFLVAKLLATRSAHEARAKRASLNIALVIDVSGSMAGEKLASAKEAALGLVRRMGPDDYLTLVSFASDVAVHLDAVPADAENLSRIEREIYALSTRGMTNLSGGWFAGVECAARLAETKPHLTPRIIILSDGQANEGITSPAELREHAGELRLRGVLTSTLGIGNDYDETLLRGIAESGGGRLHDAELSTEISSVLLGELDDIFGTVVEASEVTLTVPEGVRVEVLGRARVPGQGTTITVPVGSVQSGVEKHVVFKITCPAAQAGSKFEFSLAVNGRRAVDGIRLGTVEASAALTAVPAFENDAQPRNEAVWAISARTWSAHIVATAAQLNRERDFRHAELYVAHELRFFRRYAESLPQGEKMIRDLEMLARRVGQQFSPRMQKEMVFQSALAVESRQDRRGPPKPEWSARMERGD